MPKVSIIIPTYNSSAFIERAVGSVLRQTFTDWELLIVDDGSTDDTVDLVTEFIKQDSRIKLFRTPQNSGGPALPKNIGIENARGEYVAFLDHDDEWLPEKLAKQLKVFEDSRDEKLGLVACYININNDSRNVAIKYHDMYKKQALAILLQYNFLATSSCVIVRAEIFRMIGFFDTKFKISDDWDMWLRIARANYRFDFVPEFLCNYNMHQNNSSSNIKRGYLDFIILCEKNKNNPEMEKSWFLSYYYFNNREYNLSRKYYIDNIFSKRLNLSKRVKSFIYILFTFSPSLRSLAKITSVKIKSIMQQV